MNENVHYIKIIDGEFENCLGYIKREVSPEKFLCLVYKKNEPIEKVFSKSVIEKIKSKKNKWYGVEFAKTLHFFYNYIQISIL